MRYVPIPEVIFITNKIDSGVKFCPMLNSIVLLLEDTAFTPESRLNNELKLVIYCSAAISFLLGDFLMGTGNHVVIWSIAALGATIPIPFLAAGQNMILYEKIPRFMQGRVFAVRNALQFSTIPMGMLLGGWLADYLFEPFMKSGKIHLFYVLLGKDPGSGMALMFLFTSVLGFFTSLYCYHNKKIRGLCED